LFKIEKFKFEKCSKRKMFKAKNCSYLKNV
jgi:hypothetical protein